MEMDALLYEYAYSYLETLVCVKDNEDSEATRGQLALPSVLYSALSCTKDPNFPLRPILVQRRAQPKHP